MSSKVSTKSKLNVSTAAAPESAAILDDYLNEDQCAEALGMAAVTLAIWRMQRKGPPITRIGRRIYYRKSSLKTWLESQETPASTVSASR
jgi:predicted DNA-binding transcriptional regulator AlpA